MHLTRPWKGQMSTIVEIHFWRTWKITAVAICMPERGQVSTALELMSGRGQIPTASQIYIPSCSATRSKLLEFLNSLVVGCPRSWSKNIQFLSSGAQRPLNFHHRGNFDWVSLPRTQKICLVETCFCTIPEQHTTKCGAPSNADFHGRGKLALILEPIFHG